MNNPLLSVIILVYNSESYLSACIDSVLHQDYPDIELILVDDGSSDNSGAICDEYARTDKRVKVIHKENGGQASARNMGLNIVSGQYITFVDSDDTIAADSYAKNIELMERCKADIDILQYPCYYMYGNDNSCIIKPSETRIGGGKSLWLNILRMA